MSEDLSGSSVCGLSSMLKMRCAALLILGVLTAVNGQTDPLASSATGCFEGWAGAWKAKTGCTCPSSCRTCYHEDGAIMNANECLACKGTDKHTVVSTTHNTGTCTASAAAMLQAGTVVSAILAFAVALASA